MFTSCLPYIPYTGLATLIASTQGATLCVRSGQAELLVWPRTEKVQHEKEDGGEREEE